MSINIKEVEKEFNHKRVLDKINLNIVDGEFFGLLGPSGAGKTTLIKILTGQLNPTSGCAEVFGCNSSGLTEQIYRNIGIVYEKSGLYDRLSCGDNLYIFARIYGIQKQRIYEVLNKVGLSDSINKPVQKLSTGMKQRLIIARAIMHKPKLLFLDEPTSGLDPVSANSIHNIISEMNKNGTTVFMTTHNMSEASKLCDNIALLDGGKIIEYGTPDNICFKYNKNKQVKVIFKNKTEIISLENLSEYLSKQKDKSHIEAIHSLEPNLEDVFIQLTGKRLV